MAAIHVESRYATDLYSGKVTTICGREVPRKNAVRFLSDPHTCKVCDTTKEEV